MNMTNCLLLRHHSTDRDDGILTSIPIDIEPHHQKPPATPIKTKHTIEHALTRTEATNSELHQAQMFFGQPDPLPI